jgi:hypothetical protein
LRHLLPAAIAAVLALAGCGGGPPSPESVVRAWSTSLNAGDNEAAASLFAPGALVIRAGLTRTLGDEADALRFNAALPCSGEIVQLEESGHRVNVRLRLGDRESSRCDAPGEELHALVEVRDGKIVVWHQLDAAAGAKASTAMSAGP